MNLLEQGGDSCLQVVRVRHFVAMPSLRRMREKKSEINLFYLICCPFVLRFRYVLVVRRAESAASMLTSVFPEYVDIVEAVLSLWLHSYIPVSSKYLHTLLRLLL